MKAISISSAGATPEIRNDIALPEPGEGQILVKTLYTAINPVDQMMSSYGSPMIKSWPFTPGCDASGTIVSLGPNAISSLGNTFKKGDIVFGCPRLGTPGHATWAEYFLFDAILCVPVPPQNVSIAQAAGTGAGLLTAALGVFTCLDVPLLEAENLPEKKDEWVLVFGGSGSVGQFAVQLLALAGFKVAATGSKASFELLKRIGAAAVVDYKQSEEHIVKEVKNITGGNLNYAFDASSLNNNLLGSIYGALAPVTTSERRFTTVNAWDPLPQGDFAAKPIQLGPIGQPDASELNGDVRKIIPVVYELLKKGVLKPSEYSVEGDGVEGILKAWEVQKSGGTGGAKTIVKIADE